MNWSAMLRRRLSLLMSTESHFKRYVDLQAYVGWSDADAARVSAIASFVEQRFEPLIDDFYQEIDATRTPPKYSPAARRKSIDSSKVCGAGCAIRSYAAATPTTLPGDGRSGCDILRSA